MRKSVNALVLLIIGPMCAVVFGVEAYGAATLTLDFKWADNLQQPGDVMDFYVSGDVAPQGRFKYRYVAE
jgi:hypothetical protein